MKRTPLLLVTAAVACALTVAGCGGKTDESELQANPWVATYVTTDDGLTKTLAGTAPAIFFRSDGTAIGNATVNTFRADYVIERRLITIGGLVSSQWSGPQMEMAQERAILSALQSTQRYAVAGDELTFYAAGNEPIMRFSTAPQPELTGPVWLCTSHVDAKGQLTPVQGSAPLSLQFAPNGQVDGSGSASRFTTSYTIDGSAMTFEPWTPQVSEDAQPDLLGEDETYYDALAATAAFRINEYQLELFDDAGNVLAVHVPIAPKM